MIAQIPVAASDLSDHKKPKVQRFLHKGTEIPTQRLEIPTTIHKKNLNVRIIIALTFELV